MTKNFKIARKPGQGSVNHAIVAVEPETKTRPRKAAAPAGTPVTSSAGGGPTTRKTIEVPEDYFFQVKMRALERHMKEKDLWAEVVAEYFQSHPSR